MFEKKTIDPEWIPAIEEENVLRDIRYILHFLSTLLISSISGNNVALEYLYLLRDLNQITQYIWASVVLSYLYIDLCKVIASGDQMPRDVLSYYKYI